MFQRDPAVKMIGTVRPDALVTSAERMQISTTQRAAARVGWR